MQIHFGLGSKGLGDQVGDEGKLQQKNCIYIYIYETTAFIYIFE